MSNISIGKLGGRSTYSNSVNSTDSLDSFSISLTAGGNLSLSLTGLSADANLQLLNSSGTVIRSSSNTGTSAETIEMTGLAAGNYSVSVNQVGTASTNYNLSLTSEYAGNTLSTARNLGDLNGSSNYSDFVGTTDTSDFYRFSLAAIGSLKVGLNGLSADANIQVVRDTNNNGAIDTGELLKTSINTGTTDETISITNLAPGTYFVKAYSGTNANTNYNLSLSADYAGKTLSTARNLGNLNGSSSYSDFVGTTDNSDRYRFNLTAKGNLNVGLSSLSADANLQVIRDANNNGVIDAGDVIKGSYNSGTTAESISLTNLAAGTYFVQVYPGTGVSTNYNLSLTSEYAGNTLSTARNLGDLNGSSSYSDFVGTTDTSDRYRFNLTAKGNLNVGLSGLSADANLQVIRDANNNGAIDTGDVIKGSYNSGTTDESISLTGLAAGTYFVQVYPNTGVNTNYNLSITADYASNTLSTARNLDTLNGNSSYSDFVSTTDTVDFYRFSFSAIAALKVGLSGLSADADIEVIHDTNNNGLIDTGEVLDTSADLGTTDESISLSNLSAGTYFVKAYLGADVSTNYNLSLTADYAGKTLESARNLDTLNGNSSYSDFVGTTDSDDFYRFSLTAASDISFKLNGLSDNANLQVIRDANNNGAIDTGEVLITGTNPGTTVESLSLTSLSAGTYFIHVYPGTEANTNYSLGLTVVTSTSVVTQLSNNSYNDDGYNFQASGSKVVWRGYDDTDSEIFLYNGTTVTQLSNNSTYDYNPQFVGSKVLWQGYDGTDYEIYSYEGTTVTQLTNNSYNDYFQVVGSKALWSSYDGTDNEIYSYDGTTVTQLTNNSYDDYFQVVGSKALWSSYDGTDNEIYSYDGTTVTQLTNNSYDDSNLKVDGSIAAWNGFDGTDNEIFRYDGSRVTQVTNNSTDDSVIEVDGSNIFWQGYDGIEDYEIFRYDGSQVIQLTNNSLDESGYNFQVSGSKVLWYGYQDESDYEFYFYDGTTVTQLTNLSTYVSNPQFVGSKVLWQSYGGTKYQIYSYDGTTVTQLTNNSYNDYFQVVGSKAFWSSYDGTDYEIYSYDGTTVTQLTNNSSNDSNLQVYGSIAVWNGYDGTDYEIFRYQDSRVTQLTNNSTDDYVLQVDGSNIFWRGYDGTDYEIFRYSRVA